MLSPRPNTQVDRTWELLTPTEGHPYGPGKRYLHSAVAVANDVWLYGGSNRSDLWTWQTESSKWRQVHPFSLSLSLSHPSLGSLNHTHSPPRHVSNPRV